MPEYIEREAVHRLVRSLNKYTWKNPDKPKYRTTVDIDDVQFGIDKIPTADVVEVRHGKWIENSCYNICSVCEKYVRAWNDDGDLQEFAYCPHCGAKMDGGNNNA